MREAAAARVGALSSDLSIGSELAGYRVESLLGRGGMGVVYRALDLALDRPVALKILSPELAADPAFRDRFLRESRLAASIDHPNVIPVYDAGEIDGELYIAMRYVDGSDLKRVIADGPLGPERTVALVGQTAAALDAAHARGLVHRDVKPSNVLVTDDDHAYLADFGLTRELGEPGAALGAAHSLGTADYISPEQIRGDEVDGRADLYSLACVLQECFTGAPPFRRSSELATLYAHLEEQPSPIPDLDRVMRTALAKEPDERFQSGRELMEATRAALGLEPRRSRWPLALAAVGIALIGAALLAFFLASGGGGAKAEPGADSLVRIDPKTNSAVDTIPVGPLAGALATDARHVWVTSSRDGTVWRIDAQTGSVLKLAAQGTPTALAVGHGVALVGDGPDHKLVSFDAGTGALNYAAALSGGSDGTLQIANGSAGAWFADPAGGVGIVGKVTDVLSGGVPSEQASIPADRRTILSSYLTFDGLAVGEGGIWLAGDPQQRSVWRLDPRTTRLVATIRVPFIPKAVVAGAGAVWVTSLLGDTVSRIDPRSNRIVATLRVGRDPEAITATGDAVWVTSAVDDALWRIDPSTNRVVARIRLDGVPRAVAAGAGGVWVTTARLAPSAPRDAIKIGLYADCRGPFGGEYEDSLAGAELPLIARGGREGVAPADGVAGASIAGRPIRLYLGCNATNGGSTTAQVLSEARRLVEQVGVDVLIAPSVTLDELALQQYVRRHPQVAFVDGAGAAPDPEPAPNFFKFNTDGAQWMAGLGAYAYRTLGWRSAVTVSLAPDAFFWAQSGAFAAEFCSLGGTISKRIWYPIYTSDWSAVISRILRQHADGVVLDNGATLIALVASDPSLRGRVAKKVLLTSPASSTTLYKLGAQVAGVVSAGPSLLLPGGNPGLPADGDYLAAFTSAFPKVPTLNSPFFDIPYYDAMTATLKALDRVHGDVSGGERRFMAALAKVTLDAPNGRISLDAKHRGIGPNYLWQLRGPKLKPVVIRTIPRVDASFGGYFKPTDPPPSETTPACVKRRPPPWAR